MLGLMKLRKFLKRVGGQVNPNDLKETGFDFQRVVKLGLLAFAGLAAVLIMVFIVWPIVRAKPKAQQPKTTETQKEPHLRTTPLTYKLKNSTQSDWNEVQLTVNTFDQTMKGTDSAKLKEWRYLGDNGRFVFTIGDIKAGATKEFTVQVTSWEPETYAYLLVFTDGKGNELTRDNVELEVK